MFLPSLARVSCHNQINSLDITKAAQLPKKRDIVLIAPTFVHVSNGGRGMNEGDAMRLRSLLRARRNRPSGQTDARQCPLWVKSRHWGRCVRCSLYPE